VSVSRLASIRQGLPSPARRSPVPRSRALWIEAPDAHTIGPACERSRLAAIRQVLATGIATSPFSVTARRSPVPRSRALWPVAPPSRRE